MTALQIQIQAAKDHIQKAFSKPLPPVAVILGSGLGALVDQMESCEELKTTSIPNWPASTVQGHKGRLVNGIMNGRAVAVLQGRIHYYEGYAIQDVVFPLRVLNALGVRHLIVTNAAGSLNPAFSPGDFMIITDHINLMGTNPLIGFHDPETGPRFPDMSRAYDPEYIRLAELTGDKMGIPLKKGVLIATMGPSYETAAEVRMMQTLGGDAVCMSTVPEVIAGAQMQFRILGISCITNMCTGLSEEKLSHEEVKETTARVQSTFIPFMKEVITRIAQQSENQGNDEP